MENKLELLERWHSSLVETVAIGAAAGKAW